YQPKIFAARKILRQSRDQIRIEFDGDNSGAAFDQQPRQRALPRPDFGDRLARTGSHGINNAARVMRTDEEVLSKTALGASFGSHKPSIVVGVKPVKGSDESFETFSFCICHFAFVIRHWA